MKKIITFILLILAVNVMAQDRKEIFWPKNNEFGLDSIKVPITDTVMTYTGLGQIGGYKGVIEFDMSGLDSSVSISIGGGVSMLRLALTNRPALYSFMPYVCDSLPYTLSRIKWRKTVNGVTQNKKSFIVTISYGYPFLAIYVKRAGCTAGKKLYFSARFSRECEN